MNETLYGIGEMAKISNISIQTLRYYDEIDLFKPAYIDPQTNYRYYRDAQLYQLDLIKALKYVGTSLKDIKRAQHMNVDELLVFLDERSHAIQEQINHLTNIQQNVDHVKQRMVKQLNHSIFGEIVFRYEKETLILQSEATGLKPLDMLNASYSALKQVVETEEGAMQNGYGAIIPYQFYEKLEDIEYTHIFTPILMDKQARMLPEGIQTSTIPSGQYICILFSFEEEVYIDYYKKLLNYIEKHDIQVTGPIYEIFHPAHMTSHVEEAYVVEIKVRIA
ncbi:MAG TPA: MerR family transcriptional regulator [Bacillota bacterium]|nr:MerR family transcriptional regulator [Bacillota bacterium]